jgi:uncharacterized membrane protein
MSSALQIIFMLAFPAAVAELVKRNKIAGMIGPVVICYVVGFLLGNNPVVEINKELSKTIYEISILFAIALLLLSTDFIKWFKYAGKAVVSFTLAIVGVIISVTGWTFFFSDKIPDIWKIAGMLSGVYIGGTPNMAAVGFSLGVKQETFILLNASDLVMSSIYLLLLMSVAQRLLLNFLPSFRREDDTDRESTFHYARKGKFSKRQLLGYFGIAFLIAVVIVGISFGFSQLGKKILSDLGTSEQTVKEFEGPLILFAITLLGIACSFYDKIRNLPNTYEFGEYFLLIFCLGIGSLSNISELINSSPELFAYVACVMVTAISVHYLLAFIFRIDADTVLITSTAGIFGPAFIGPVASALKNKNIVVSGLTTGLAGYAVANFIGVALAYFLKSFVI